MPEKINWQLSSDPPPQSLSSGRWASPGAGALLGGVGQRWRLPARPVRKRALWEAPSPRQPAQGGGADSAELAVRAPLQRLPIGAGETQSVGPDQPLCAAGKGHIFINLFLLSRSVQKRNWHLWYTLFLRSGGVFSFFPAVDIHSFVKKYIYICHRHPFICFWSVRK